MPLSEAEAAGWISIAACGRTNGEYIIFAEEDLNEKALMYRWTPSTVASSLAGKVTTSKAAASLTAEGPRQLNPLGRRQPHPQVRRRLADQYLHPTGGAATVYSNDLCGLSWTGSTLTASATASKNGLYISGNAYGFSFTAPRPRL